MSTKTIDDRIVSLQFDNKQFEKEVSVTLSTLDKLRSKLNIPASTKAFDNITASAKKVDMSPISKSVDTIQAKFSTLDVVAVTAISNITNSLLNLSKNIINSLTLKPVMTGLDEYETKINAIQTIMSNTASKGTTMADVTRVLDELNTYADKTIYNFAEMTRNIGTFTAAGVGLEESAAAIQGIANLAAASGSSSQQAATAMYQLSQALAAGTVKLMDWNSVVNAGMGGEKFQLALKDTAREMGIAVDSIIEKNGSFRESLREGWLSAEVLNTTLKKFTVEGATEYANAMLKAGKYTQEQADALIAESQNMEDAATKVKTLTQLWSTLQETAQSGWAKTWEIIFGDFEQARNMFSEIYNFLGPVIDSISDARNNLLQGAFSSRWSQFSNELAKAGIDVEKFQNELANVAGVDLSSLIEQYGSFESSLSSGWAKADLVKQALQNIANEAGAVTEPVEDMNAKLEEFQRIVDEVWYGSWKNGEDRIKLLTEAGYDYAEVQGLVNKSINGYRLTLDDLSDSQMKAVGYTEEEIAAIKNLMEQAEQANTPINDLINSLDKPSGRELFLGSLYNMVQPLIKSLEILHDAWQNAFPPITSQQLYNILEGFNSLTKIFVISDTTAEKLLNTFKGLFAAIDLLIKPFQILFGSLFKVASVTANILFNTLGLGSSTILDMTSNLGKALVNIRDWVEQTTFVTDAIASLTDGIINTIKFFSNLVMSVIKLQDSNGSLNSFKNAIQGLVDIFNKHFSKVISLINQFVLNVSSLESIDLSSVPQLFSELLSDIQNEFKDVDFKEIGKNIIDGLTKGLTSGLTAIGNIVVGIAESLMTTFCNLLGIHSPSVVFEGYGENIIDGLVNGIQNGITLVKNILYTLVSTIGKIFGSLDFTDVALLGGGFGILFVANQLSKALTIIAKPFGAIAGILNEARQLFDFIGDYINAQTLKVKSEALYTMAKALAVLVGSLVALTFIDTDKLLPALGALISLVAVLGIFIGYAAILSKLLASTELVNVGKVSILLISLGASLGLLALSLKAIASINSDEMLSAMKTVTQIMLLFSLLVATYGLLVNSGASKNISKVGTLFVKLGIALALMGLAIKILGGIDDNTLSQGLNTINHLALLMGALIVASAIAVNAKDSGNLILKFALSLIAISTAIKIISGISPSDLGKSLMVLTSISSLYIALIAVSSLPGTKLNDSGGMILKMSAAILLLSMTIKLIGTMSLSDVIKGIAVLAACGLLFSELIIVSSIAGSTGKSASSSFMKIAASIAILALTIKLVAGLESGDIIKALGFMSGCTLIFIAMGDLAKYAGANASKAGTMFIKMAAAMSLLVITVRLIRSLSVSDIAKGTAFILACEAMFMALVWVSKYAGANADKAGTMLMKMSLPIAILAGSVALLSLLDPKKVAFSSAAMVAVVLSLAAAIKASSFIGEEVSLKPFIMLTVIIGLLGGILALLSLLPVEKTLATAASLSILMLSLSVALSAMSIAGKIAPNAMIGILALSGVVAILATILGILSYLNLELSIQNAISLSILLVSMAGVFAILSSVGVLAPIAVAGALGFVKVISIIGIFLAAIGGLVTLLPEAETFMTKGISILETLAYGLGSVLGNLVGGFASGITSGLPKIGQDLSDFMENARTFIDGAKNIDEASMKGVQSLAGAILVLTGTDLVDSLTSWITGGTSLSEFGEQLVPFGDYMAQYSDKVKNINPGAVLLSAQAAEALSKVVANLPNSGGVVSFFTGENDMSTFGEKLVPFGQAMVDYANAVSDLNVTAIEQSATAAQSLSDLANNLPNSGGWAGTILGENDMVSFGNQLVIFGEKITEYSNAVSSLETEPISASVSAAQSLSELANNLPNSGGWAASILGDNDLSSFAENLIVFGEAIKTYSNTVFGIDSESITASISATKSLVKVFDSLPQTGGISSWFDGDKDLSSFATNIESLGTAISKYGMSVIGIDPEAIQVSISSAKSLLTLINNMKNLDISGIDLFTQAITSLSNLSLNSAIGDFGALTESLNNIGMNIISAISNGMVLGQEVLNLTFMNMFYSLFEYLVLYQETFILNGYQIAVMIAQGILLGLPYTNSVISILVANMFVTLLLYKPMFYTAGMNMVLGFIQGIRDYIWMAAQAAAEMARQAIEAANAELGIASPSKVFTKIGKFIPEGLIKGMSSMGKAVTAASKDMADKSINGTKNILSKVNDKLNNSLNSAPVIRPVIDLNAMESDIETLNSMFSSEAVLPSISNVKANLPSDDKDSSLNQNELQNANKGTVVNYTQINNSPKALDRTTIYRQTKNQLSTLKGALSKS